MIRPARFLAGLAIFTFFVIAAGRAADAEFASAGGGGSRGSSESSVDPASPRGLPGSERASELTGVSRSGKPASASSSRSVSACGASSIGPDGRVTVTSCGERLSERGGVSLLPASGISSPSHVRAPRSESLYQGKQASIAAIRKVFGRRAPAAIRVASCETGGTFYARSVGRAGERGLFQIHPIHFSWAQPARLFDPVWNSRVAYRLSRGGTRWGPWSCRWAA